MKQRRALLGSNLVRNSPLSCHHAMGEVVSADGFPLFYDVHATRYPLKTKSDRGAKRIIVLCKSII